jgi:oligoendopeptidase F
MSKASFNGTAMTIDKGPSPIDLSGYYAGTEDSAIQTDKDASLAAAAKFEADYKGRVAQLTADELAEAYQKLDNLWALAAKPIVYASFLTSMDTQDKAAEGLNSQVRDFSTKVTNSLTFFTLELSKIDQALLDKMVGQSAKLARYKPAIDKAVKNQPYLLTEPEEKILTILNNTGGAAWSRYMTQLLGQAKFSYEGIEKGLEEVLALTGSPDREVRRKSLESVIAGLNALSFHTTFITNTLAKDKQQTDELRKYPAMVSARNIGNNIEDEVVDALNASVTSNYSRLSHKYYALKAAYMGLDQLEPWDRNAPVTKDDDVIGFGDAAKIVCDTYQKFSPRIGEIARMFFDNHWIDAIQRPNKKGGAFAQSGSVLAHPIQFINWLGKRRDVYTLAHETGHNIHQYLAAKNTKSQILSNTPLTLAETASVFGEKLLFEHMLSEEKDPSKRVAMLFGKVDDMTNTVVRQIAFYNFELAVHGKIRDENRPLKTEEINALFVKTQQDALGSAVKVDERSGPLWSYVTHFTSTPFYVYAYAFGDCLVNALYRQYENATDKEKFVQDYTALLEAGGTLHHSDALKPFGIDLKDPSFWDKGMDVFAEMINKLEQAIAEEQAFKLKASPDPAPKPA